MIKWNFLDSDSKLDELIKESFTTPIVIFKHSTTCPISSIAKLRIDQDFNGEAKMYYLDLLSYRNISNKIAETFMINHQSPQVLVIKDGDCIYDESHLNIQAEVLKSELV